MANDDDTPEWMPGQPAPWLTAYGPVPAPVDDTLAGAPGAPQDLYAPPAPAPSSEPVQSPAPPPAPPPVDDALAGVPSPEPAFLQPAPPPSAPAPTAPQAPPSPDTISGAGESAPAGTAQDPQKVLARAAVNVATDPSSPIADRQRAWQALPPDVRANIVNNADPKQLSAIATAAMSPEELATIALRHEQARIHEQTQAQLELQRQAEEQARQNFYAQQVAFTKAQSDTTQLELDAKALSQQKIDPNEHGVGHFIATVLTAALGGAMSPYTGGRNLALEELDKRTQQRIDAQKANIANQYQALNFKRNLIAEQYARSGDLYRAQETYRIATYDRAISELQTKMQDYDPQGTTALRGAMAVQQVSAARQQALQAFGQQQFKNTLDAAKVDLDKQKAEQDAQQKQAELAQQERSSQRSAYVAMRGQDIGLAEKKLEEQGKQAERAQAKAEKLTEQDRTLGVPIPGVGVARQADGTVWHAPSDDEAKATRKQIAATANYNKLANDMIRGISEHGGESDYLKSDDWKRMTVKMQEATAALHDAYGVTSFRENTVDFFEKMATAGVNPTSFVRDASEALRTSNEDMQSKLNVEMAAGGYTGAPIKFADLSALAPAGNPFAEKTVSENAEGKAEGKVLSTIRKTPILGAGGDPVADAENNDTQDAARIGKPTGLTIDQQNRVDDLVAKALQGGREGKAASDALIAYVKDQRPSLRAGILTTLRGDAPKLWEQAIAQLPADEQKQQQAMAAVAVHHSPTLMLIEAAKNGDAIAGHELEVRAAAGDQAALGYLVPAATDGGR
jgi:hypothetical protein